MDLDGHYLITKAAMAELRGKLSFLPAAVDLAAVNRDLEDLLGGHWMAAGQKHHFMAIKGESPEKAYATAMAWIKGYATQAAAAYIGGFGTSAGEAACMVNNSQGPGSYANTGRVIGAAGSGPMKGQKVVPIAVPARLGEFPVMACTGARPLGTAAHAVEDSFAPMHVVRGGGGLGTITSILVYEEQEENGQGHQHDAEDRKWEGSKGEFSEIGQAAVEAVKDLFLVVDVAVRSGKPYLSTWDSYVSKWFQKDFGSGKSPTNSVVPATAPVVSRPSHLITAGPSHYTVKGGDSLSTIAGAYYRDVLLWPVIHDANRRIVQDPNFIQPGWILSIPPASSVSDESRPALRERGRHWRSGG